MKTIFLLLDSLNRNAIEPYGSKVIKTPNFNRFAEKSIIFENHYVGSLPCMPARRDLHTGRTHFLHRSWGPLEPFDDSFPEIMKNNNVYSHIITDHHHYFADGGGTYHQRYSSWELIRGQAIDKWKGEVSPDLESLKQKFHPMQHHRKNYIINRNYIVDEQDFCTPRLYNLAKKFIKKNYNKNDWFLQLECFDPHEPFHAPERFRKNYNTNYKGPILDWPIYERVKESEEEIAELRANYCALVSMCDEYFGKILDLFDENNLWEDTCLILTTDHGFLLGEHDWWAKNRMPVYNEIAKIPLIIYHPDFSEYAGTRRKALTQSIDIMPTLLDFHNLNIPNDVIGKSLIPLLNKETNLRESLIYGYFGAAINVTDGKYTYLHYPKKLNSENLFEYTLMPTRMTSRFSIKELLNATLDDPFNFTKGVPVMKLSPKTNEGDEVLEVQGMKFEDTDSRLFDLKNDPNQLKPIKNQKIENDFKNEIVKLMKKVDAPLEAYKRFGLEDL